MKTILYTTWGVFVLFAIAEAQEFPRANAELAEYDAALSKMEKVFASVPGEDSNKAWVKKKLQHMCDTDQYMRNFSLRPDKPFGKDEREYFDKEFLNRWQRLDK